MPTQGGRCKSIKNGWESNQQTGDLLVEQQSKSTVYLPKKKREEKVQYLALNWWRFPIIPSSWAPAPLLMMMYWSIDVPLSPGRTEECDSCLCRWIHFNISPESPLCPESLSLFVSKLWLFYCTRKTKTLQSHFTIQGHLDRDAGSLSVMRFRDFNFKTENFLFVWVFFCNKP